MQPRNNATELFRNSASQPLMRENDFLQRQIEIARKTPVRTVDLDGDSEFRELVRHALKPEETLKEFVARTGLGKATILAQHMSPAAITRFCEQAELNAATDQCGPVSAWQPRQAPKHFEI